MIKHFSHRAYGAEGGVNPTNILVPMSGVAGIHQPFATTVDVFPLASNCNGSPAKTYTLYTGLGDPSSLSAADASSYKVLGSGGTTKIFIKDP